MERPIVGITISVNFSSVLELTMPINIHHFAKWYIITDQKDQDTISLCHNFDPQVVECRYFDFQANHKLLNKGGALRFGQLTAHRDHPERGILSSMQIFCFRIILKNFWVHWTMLKTHYMGSKPGMIMRPFLRSEATAIRNIFTETSSLDFFNCMEMPVNIMQVHTASTSVMTYFGKLFP